MMRRVELMMGTAIEIDVRDPAVDTAVLDAAFDHLRDVDARFSTFKSDSEISRLDRGDLQEADCSADAGLVLVMCEEARIVSDGYFDIRRHRSDGGLDPSGLVKGWSVEGACRILDAAGVEAYCINAGGDVFARGVERPGSPWRIGIRNPWDARTVSAVVSARDLAIATSGTYERGEHVIVPHTGRPPPGIVSMTVIGPSITWADAWATAAFAMGVRGVEWVASELEGYEASAITTDRHVISSVAFERFMVAP